MGLSAAIAFFNCAAARHYDLSLRNTVSIFLLHNDKDYYFCMPVQYTGEYQIETFDFTGGYIKIGDYELSLKRDGVNIYAYLNEEAADPFGMASGGAFDLVYSEESGRILTSKLSELLAIKHASDEKMNHYCFFIERHLGNDEMKKIIDEYEKGNISSQFFIGYDITIDNELQSGSGMKDDFELSNEPFMDPSGLFPNLDFFRAKYLQKQRHITGRTMLDICLNLIYRSHLCGESRLRFSPGLNKKPS